MMRVGFHNSPAVDFSARKPYIDPAATPLTSVTSSTAAAPGGLMEPTPSIKDYVDARNDAIESRLTAKLQELPTRAVFWGGVGTVIGTILAVGSLIIAMLAFGSDRFNDGLSVSPMLAERAAEQRKVDEAQDAKLMKIESKIDILLERSSK